MSNRIVVIGPQKDGQVKVLDVSPMDAGAMLAGAKWRVCLSLFSGPLSDATVIVSTGDPVTYGGWDTLKKICYGQQETVIDTPIPLYERTPS